MASVASSESKPLSVFCSRLLVVPATAPLNCKPDVHMISVLPMAFGTTMMVVMVVPAMVAFMSVATVLVLVAEVVAVWGFGAD